MAKLDRDEAEGRFDPPPQILVKEKTVMKRNLVSLSLLAVLLPLAGCGPASAPEAPADQAEFSGAWTDTDYPSYIRRLTHFGQRADWSHDGKRMLFIEKTYGDVYEIDLETEVIRPMTHHYYHNGYTRALYLSNGDVLLSGSRTFDPENIRPARHETAELWVLSKDLDKAPVALGEYCSEGPAVSRHRLRIAWAADHANYPDRLSEDESEVYMADIDYSGSEPKIANKTKILDNDNSLGVKANWETQNFTPPNDDRLTLAAYGYQGTDVFLLDIASGELSNITETDVQYDEPEGIFPDGEHTLVESDHHVAGKGSLFIDIYKVPLDGSATFERITRFNEEGVYKGTNPVVSDDGRYIAFQVPRSDQIAGIGSGIYMLDLEAAGLR